MTSKIKFTALLAMLLSVSTGLFALPFNSKLTEEERQTLLAGETVVKSINNEKNICLISGTSELGDSLLVQIDKLNPKYLAEVIQIRPYEGNEDFPSELDEILDNVEDYAGIPYWSVRHETYFDLYSSAAIVSEQENENSANLKVQLEMEPFGIVNEDIEERWSENEYTYIAVNSNSLKYNDNISCIGPKKLKLGIYLFRDGDYWILYGIGGVNAPRVPLLTERIETSFINRIKTFCNFVFTKI